MVATILFSLTKRPVQDLSPLVSPHNRGPLLIREFHLPASCRIPAPHLPRLQRSKHACELRDGDLPRDPPRAWTTSTDHHLCLLQLQADLHQEGLASPPNGCKVWGPRAMATIEAESEDFASTPPQPAPALLAAQASFSCPSSRASRPRGASQAALGFRLVERRASLAPASCSASLAPAALVSLSVSLSTACANLVTRLYGCYEPARGFYVFRWGKCKKGYGFLSYHCHKCIPVRHFSCLT